MNPIRKNFIRGGIAEILDQCEPHLVLDRTILAQLNMTLRPPATEMEFNEVVNAMEAAKQIIHPRNADQELSAKLTTLGRAELLQKG